MSLPRPTPGPLPSPAAQNWGPPGFWWGNQSLEFVWWVTDSDINGFLILFSFASQLLEIFQNVYSGNGFLCCFPMLLKSHSCFSLSSIYANGAEQAIHE